MMTTSPQPFFQARKATSLFLEQVYQQLYDAYGPQHWWPADSDFEMIIGAILTQSTSWTNVEKAILNLKQHHLLSVQSINHAEHEILAECIRSSGYFNQKAKKIKAFIQHVMEHHQGRISHLLQQPADVLRHELLSIHGIGKETADSIILYASRQPVFVIDAYTRRIFFRLGCNSEDTDYDQLQEMFHSNLNVDVSLFNEYHALIVAFGKNLCRKTPDCNSCFMQKSCWYWKTQR